jgi:lysophospholipase L1-like esterase
MVVVPVINLGRAGISTVDGLKLLPAMIAARPQAVIIELGGHDFLKGYPREAAKENLQRIIRTAREAGAEPILIEVPRGFIIDPYAGLERELAHEENLELISDGVIRKLVLWSPYAPPGMWTGGPYLSDDGLHPNAAGNDELARAAARALRRVFGEEILRAGR